MKILFQRKHKYHLQQPSELVQKKLRFITSRRYDDYSIDIIGKLEPNGRFQMMHKWGITNTQWIENRRAYLQGLFSEDVSGTCLEIRLRPNIVFIVAFYIVLSALAIELLGFNLIPFFSKQVKIIALAAINLGMLLVIFYSVNNLKKRFEQLMQIR